MTGFDETPDRDGLRMPWSRSERALPRRVIRPLQEFLAEETASAVVLLAAAALALAWANSAFASSYVQLWGTEFGLHLGRWSIQDDLRGWINDGAMSLFFLVVGLEIKRELTTGELRERRTAVLPVVAALAGMLVPALVFLAFVAGSPAAGGWGIAMPTDIPFALGVLALASPRVPPGLRVFLLALGIVDDIGSVVVVAIVYRSPVDPSALAAAIALCLIIVACQRVQVRATLLYVTLGVLVWLATNASGISPTIAGVALGLLTPAVPFQRPRAVSEEAHRTADETVDDPIPPDADAPQWLRLAELSREAVSPLARVERLLLPWTSFVIVPLFALANAGVRLGGAIGTSLTTAVLVARVLGKPLGITLACLVAVRIGAARLPDGVTWGQVVGVGAVAGIPFTVSLLVAGLAFTGSELSTATIAVLVAAVAAGMTGALILRFVSLRRPDG